MTKFEELQSGLVEFQEHQKAYWDDLDALAIRIRNGFESYLELPEGSSFLNHSEKRNQRYVELGKFNAPDGGSSGFTIASSTDDFDGDGLSVCFVLRLTIPHPDNEKRLGYIDYHFDVSRSAERYHVRVQCHDLEDEVEIRRDPGCSGIVKLFHKMENFANHRLDASHLK